MKIVIDSSKESLVTKVHLNIDSTSIELSDLSSVSSVSIVEKEGEVFIDSVSKEEKVIVSDPKEVAKNDSILDKTSENNIVSDDIETVIDERLFQKLVDLRRSIAKESKIPPYYIFHDKSLKEMATFIPCGFEEMRNITGVGDSKLEKYGLLFIESIQKHLDEFT